MTNIKKIILKFITVLLSIIIFFTVILFLYAAFFYKPGQVEKKNIKIEIVESHIQSKNKPKKKEVLANDAEKPNVVIKPKTAIQDSLFATVGDKAVTYSDILNEMKMVLIINNLTFSEVKRKQLEQAAVESTINRTIKKIEIEKFKSLQFDQNDLNAELYKTAKNLNMDLKTLKNKFISNGVDFSTITNQYETELLWNSLIFMLYRDKISINQDEINEQLKLIENNKEIEEYLLSEIVIRAVTKDNLESEIKEIKNKITNLGFEETAMSVSIAESAINGGSLGWININTISDQFKSKIINTPTNGVSEPVLQANNIYFFKVRDKRKTEKFINLEEAKNYLVTNEKTKILNMYSQTHFDNLRRTVTVNFF